ncbi:hypothetical protein [Bhargavaea ginsengi]|uniref:hypothetical protein n=1 Tax=Bhargavaea ginsengi TaxID=426757 RepID=UPI003C793BCB
MTDQLLLILFSALATAVVSATWTVRASNKSYEQGHDDGHAQGFQKGLKVQIHKIEKDGEETRVHWQEKKEERE